MFQIAHRIGIAAEPSAVFAAIDSTEGLSRWWTEEVEGECAVGGRVTFTFRKISGEILGQFVMEVTRLTEPEQIEWKCVEGPSDWIGTEISFNLKKSGEQTIVVFAHRNWREMADHLAHCSTKWATFLLSLRGLLETGTGKPSPHDLKIDDWN